MNITPRRFALVCVFVMILPSAGLPRKFADYIFPAFDQVRETGAHSVKEATARVCLCVFMLASTETLGWWVRALCFWHIWASSACLEGICVYVCGILQERRTR